MKRVALLLLGLFLVATPRAHGQATGFPPYGSFQDGGFDAINRQDLNVNFAIPVVSRPGRGMDFKHAIVYDSLLWQKVTVGSTTSWTPVTDPSGNPTWGWKKDFPGGSISYRTSTVTIKCFPPDGSPWFWTTRTSYGGYAYTDVMGTRHSFSVNPIDDTNCSGGWVGTLTGNALDGSGYYMDATTATSPVATSPGGIKSPSGSVTDTNGNLLTKIVVSSTVTKWIDTLNHEVLTIDTTNNPALYQYLATDGTKKSIKVTFTTTQIKTNFGCSGIVEYTGSASLPTQIDIPIDATNFKSYVITYEPTPQNSGYYTGRVQRVTLPLGGYSEYDYPTNPATDNNGINCADSTGTNLTRKVSDGTTTATWQFTRVPTTGSGGTTTVTAPQLSYDSVGNDSAYVFDTNGHETSRKFYQGSAAPGTLLRTVNTTWAANGTPATQVTILEDNSTQSETDTTFDSNGNLTQVIEYDWGTGSHGSLLRTTNLFYLNSSAYTARNILNRLTRKTVLDSAGVLQFRQDIAYDGASNFTAGNCITGATQHDDSNYGCSFLTRGNPISVTTYKDPVTPANGVVKNFSYDSLGNLTLAAVNCCQQKQWNFLVTTQYAFPDSVVSGPSTGPQLTTSATYNSYTGLTSTSKDENDKVTTFTYDLTTLRLTDIQRPDQAHITYAYNYTDRIITVSKPIDGTNVLKQSSYFDSLGRPTKSTILDGANSSYSTVETQYDVLGRAWRTSNPHNSSPQYWTETRFDGLGRPTVIIPPGGSVSTNNTSYSYATTTVTVTDPAGKKRKSQADAAGRLLKVTEPDTNGVLNVDTTSAYTVLDALAQVSQDVQTRTYTYDKLGRLTNATTPEAGGVSYAYNDFNLVTQRTDARSVITNYSYDTLNRAQQVSYNVGSTGVPATPSVNFTYGTDKTQNNNGRMITMTDGVGSESYTFDTNLPLVTQVQKLISGTTYTTQYQYNLAGEAKQIQYPSGRKVQPAYDAIGRLATVADTMGTVNTTYASGFTYNPAFQVLGLNYGNGVAASFGYSADRLQLTSLSYAKGAQTLFSLSYGYTQGPGNNGQITSITDGVDSGRTVNYTYDPLGRLKTAVTNGSAAYPQWGLGWTYDRYGNRTAQSISAGCVAPQTCPTNSVTVDATTNRITGAPYAYDANGNLTNDGLNTLTYDAENHAVSSATGGTTSTYTYDGKSLRVKKQVGSASATVYIFSGTKVIAEYASGANPNSPTREYIYSGSALLATIAGSTTTYHHPDHLSVRLTTDTGGNALGQQGHYPYGESWYASGTTTKWQFTTYERDGGTNESGNDYAMMRYHVNRLGRFNSPDPLAGSIKDPQSLNRFAYVRSDPGNSIDPLGLRYVLVELCSPQTGPNDETVLSCTQVSVWVFDFLVDERGGGGDPGGGDPQPARPSKPNPLIAALIERQWQQYQECVRQGASGLATAPTSEDVVREAQKDSMKPMRPNVPGLPAGGNMPALPGKGPEADLPSSILDMRAYNKRKAVEDDCENKFPLARLNSSFRRDTQ